MSSFAHDRSILRPLAARCAQLAAMDVQTRNIQNWRALYARRPVKPMFSIDQICWEEFEGQEELRLLCVDPLARQAERALREILYRWQHFPCDMVIKPYFALPKLISDSGIGVQSVIRDETGHAGALSHLYEDCIPDEEALERLHAPVITYEKERSEQAKQRLEEYFGDILPVRLTGTLRWESPWDSLVFWRGAEAVLYDLMDRPEFLHAIMQKLVRFEMAAIDQLEEQNLLEAQGALCHCLETYCDDLPAPGFDPQHVRAQDCWVSGAAQIFSEVSPRMHAEFEIDYMKPVFERFGLVNYGCCEPLHHKIDIIRRIRNVRAISISPWADPDIAAEAMGRDYVMARKPNPAFLASGTLDEQLVRDDLRRTIAAAKAHNRPLEMLLKDISTVSHNPSCLWRWQEIAMEELQR